MRARHFIIAMLSVGFVALQALPATAQPAGVALTVTELKQKDRDALLSRIAKARTEKPEAFVKVRGVVDLVPQLDRTRRGRFASISRQLKAIGADGIAPMLEMLAVEGPARGQLTDSGWVALRVGLIEAVGMHRDPSAAPVLSAILKREKDPLMVRAAAEALGRIGSDETSAELVALAKAGGEKRLPVLAGMGYCRRAACATALSDASRAVTDVESARVVIRALGETGDAWAWATPSTKKSEQGAVRSTAAKALIDVFTRVHGDAQLRLEVQKAVLRVDDPATPGMIEGAKSGASPELARALDALKQKFKHSPLHKYR